MLPFFSENSLRCLKQQKTDILSVKREACQTNMLQALQHKNLLIVLMSSNESVGMSHLDDFIILVYIKYAANMVQQTIC